MSEFIRLLSPASPRLPFRITDVKRMERIREAYTFVRSFRTGYRGDWRSIRPKFNSPDGTRHIFVKTVTSFHDPENHRLLFGVSFESFVPLGSGDSGRGSKMQNPLAGNEFEALALAAEIITREVSTKFPDLGIQDISASFRPPTPTSPKRSLTHGHAFHLILEVSLVAR